MLDKSTIYNEKQVENNLTTNLHIFVQLVPSLTLKLAHTPPPTTNFWTTYRQHTKLKFGMQAYSNPNKRIKVDLELKFKKRFRVSIQFI